MSELLTRAGLALHADPARVVARLFVPGHEQARDRQSRATGVLARILSLSDDVVVTTRTRVLASFGDRHRDLLGVVRSSYDQIAHRVPGANDLSQDRRDVIGAWFTHEFAIEGAALFNPSVVAHPDQSGLQPGQLRFVMSLRAVGEGHISSVEFRAGVLGPDQQLHLDEPGPHVELGSTSDACHDKALFAAKLADAGADSESSSYLLSRLPDTFDTDQLEHALVLLAGQRVTRHGSAETAGLALHLARCTYEVEFPVETSLAERVLWPQSPSESRGIEDVRLVRFVADDGTASYRATYTAYDGERIAPQLIETDDFRRFRLSQLAGPAARDKGMAMFPRTIGGRYFALTRSDRENTGVASSADGRWWGEPEIVHRPSQPWELIQTGNCGSPVETEAGWLVLTHGVGPMREYSIGAILLDLDDPTRVVGDLVHPLLGPRADEREGYVPNVVYSCGSLLHGEQLLLPYAVSDESVRFAFVDVPELLERMTSGRSSAATRENSPA